MFGEVLASDVVESSAECPGEVPALVGMPVLSVKTCCAVCNLWSDEDDIK